MRWVVATCPNYRWLEEGGREGKREGRRERVREEERGRYAGPLLLKYISIENGRGSKCCGLNLYTIVLNISNTNISRAVCTAKRTAF